MKGLPRLFWILWASTLVNRLGYVVQPFFALYLSGTWRASPTLVGTVLACFGAGAFLSQPLGGHLADRLGRRPTLVLGLLVTATTLMAMPFAPNLFVLTVFAGLYGLVIDIYRPAVSALVVDTVEAEDRTRAFGLLYWAVNIGTAMAGVAGGALAARSFWLLFVLNAMTCVSVALVAARFVPGDGPVRRRPEHERSRPALTDGLLIGVTATFFVFACLLVQAYVTLPLVMRGDGLGPAAYGLVFAVNPAVVIALQPLTLRWLAALPSLAVYAGGIALTGAGFGLTAFASAVPAYAASVLVWTCGEIAVAAVGPALIAEIAPPDMQGRYNGVFGAAFGAANLAGPVTGATLLQHGGTTVLWAACAAAGLANAVLVLALNPSLRRRRVALRTP